MADTENNQDHPASDGENAPKKIAGVRELVAIIIGITCGVLVGALYGYQMWYATGGPEREVKLLSDTYKQKLRFIAEAEKNADKARQAGNSEEAAAQRKEAKRLRGHLGTIEYKLAEMKITRDQAKKDENKTSVRVAGFVMKATEFVGDIFLQALTMLVIPLVVASMICGVASLGDVRKLGRLGAWTVGYYFSTCAVAVLIGIILVQVIEPGKSADDTFAFVPESVEQKKDVSAADTLLDVFRGNKDSPGSGMFPSNIFLAASKTNVLALIVFSIVFGAALTTLGEKGRRVIEFFKGVNGAVMVMVHLLMFIAPIGIYGLVAMTIARQGGGDAFLGQLTRLGWYTMTVIIGLGIHSLFLASLLPVFTRRNPWTYTKNTLPALVTACGTASSSATLPVTISCCEDDNNVSTRSAGFVLPLGATINMDGTALYEAVAAIFIAQSLGIPLDFGSLLVIFLTATLAAVGAAGIPEAGLVTMVVVLTAVGLPLTGIGAILAVDWFLDRLRTTVNVYGDAVGAAFIDSRVPPES